MVYATQHHYVYFYFREDETCEVTGKCKQNYDNTEKIFYVKDEYEARRIRDDSDGQINLNEYGEGEKYRAEFSYTFEKVFLDGCNCE